MRGLSVTVAMLVAVAACQTPPQDTLPVDEAADRAAVENTITDWFNSGLAKGDTAAVGRYLTPSFAILEDSVWYDRDGFLKFVASLPSLVGGPFTITYTLSDWRTAVHGDVAWTSLRNHAMVAPQNGEPFPLDWRETVVLQRAESRWLIDRYHSATVR